LRIHREGARIIDAAAKANHVGLAGHQDDGRLAKSRAWRIEFGAMDLVTDALLPRKALSVAIGTLALIPSVLRAIRARAKSQVEVPAEVDVASALGTVRVGEAPVSVDTKTDVFDDFVFFEDSSLGTRH